MMFSPKWLLHKKIGFLCLALGLVGVLGLVVPLAAQTVPNLVYIWTAPNQGSPVDHYIVEVMKNGVLVPELYGETTGSEPTFILVSTFGDEYQIRVAGVDAEGQVGLFSVWSEPHSVEAPMPLPPPH